ncbi:TAXI family TRAP transporter solute-binding subunit [Streptomyces sp. A7024]|uniref:TAXI family TRAP transporter solute-binding subunit n=1 Tax=Streptomyces coryli TaxID=1128680 RepID=A0A6G4U565_9ACTN|nr:TAXI family TRAP transporter solute-binding subunit [Streptomyces coryli]NGN67379.1 TAXI family TRAP transporter solute-binding subunit [Streptomyces coryli]
MNQGKGWEAQLRSRRGITAAVAVLAAAGLLLSWLLPGGSDRPSGDVTFATGVPNGVYETYGELLREETARDLPDVRIELAPSQGSVDNVRRLAEGRADFAVAASDAVAAYDGPNARRLRACARLYDDYVQLVVPEGSDIERAADLKGKRVGVGEDESGVQLIARRLVRAAGLDFNREIEPVGKGLDDMQEGLRTGDLDAFFWSGGLPTTSVRKLAEDTDIKLVPLDDLITPLHQQDDEATRYYRAAVMPPDAYPDVQRDRAVKTIAVANLLLTTDRTDDRLTEGLTRSVIRSRDGIGKKVHAAQKVDLRTAVFTDPLQLHPGAARYYRSVKP